MPSGCGLPDNGPIFRFYAPCQVDIIHLQHKQHRLDFRLCIISHFDNEPDLALRFVGPYYPNQITQAIDDYIHSLRWQRPLPEPEKSGFLWGFGEVKTYSDALSHSIINAYSQLRTYLNNTIQSEGIDGRSLGMNSLPGGCFAWGIGGRIEKSHADAAIYAATEVHREIEQQERRSRSVVTQKPISVKGGLGAFLLPPIWIGEAPAITVKEYLDGTHLEVKGHHNVVARLPYRNFHLFITQSGFFCLDTDDRQSASQALNELFAAALFFDHIALTVAPTDLIAVSNVETPLTGFSLNDDVNKEQSDRLWGEPAWRGSLRRTAVIGITKIEEIARWSEKTTSESVKALVMQFCLDAWSYFYHREYRSAFLAAWTVCELACNELWECYLTGQCVTGKMKNELLRWDVSRILDLLLVNKRLSEESFYALDEVRRERNRVMHGGKLVTRESGVQIINLTMRLVSVTWKLPLPEDLMANFEKTH